MRNRMTNPRDRVAASMEPLPFRSGMKGAPNDDWDTEMGFNGAAPIQERNAFADLQVAKAQQMGFNGAAPIQERNDGAIVENADCRTVASMEPLPFRSGMMSSAQAFPDQRSGFNGAAPIQERNVNFVLQTAAPSTAASMEPLPFRSGMQPKRKPHTVCQPASMEPLPFRSGMDTFGVGCSHGTKSLQWSRSHSGAECERWVLRCDLARLFRFNGAAPIQERNVGRSFRPVVWHYEASMEPLPFRSGMPRKRPRR